MKVITLEQAKRMQFKDLSLALGTFDGLHTGHMALIDALKSYPGMSAVFTFDSLPIALFCAENKPLQLFTTEEKIAAFDKTGIDYLCITAFDKRFASIDSEVFASMISRVFTPKNVVAGYNYTYGRRALGNADTLEKYGKEHGYNVKVIPPVIYDGEPVSSTRVRECIAAGRMSRANALLGYAYSISGVVGRGRGFGAELGFPTANISVAKEKILPLRGVYSVDVAVDGEKCAGVCNIGVKPTVSKGREQTIEIHIVSLSKDLYGQKITAFFNKRLRDERKFGSTEALRAQILCDISNI